VELQVLGVNDYHGHLEAGTPGSVDGEPAGGGEYLAAKLNELRAGAKNSLTVAAGDLIGGTPALSSLFHDEPSVESLNAMQLDVSSVGNHEFDEGIDELLRMQNGGCHPIDGCFFPADPYAGADFPWLAANVQSETTGETVLPPYWVERVQNIKVGFIGMTLEGTPTLVAKSGIEGWEFLDEAETANALVPELKAQGVEAIVVLLHEGAQQNPPPGDINACQDVTGPVLAIHDALDPEIDAMITGHTHQPYNCTLTDPDGQPRLVTSAYSFGRVVTEMNLVLDKRTKDVRRDLSSATNHAVVQAELSPDPAQTAVIEKWRPLFDEVGNEPIGQITADIVRGGNPPGDDRGVESAAGNLVADAQLFATQDLFGAQIAFMNPGGVRSDLTFASSAEGEGDGVVTFGEALTFQPFNNTLFSFPMTGAQIVSVLEDQCQPAGSSRPFLHLGVSDGFTYDLATTIEDGDCTSVTVSNVELDGAPLDVAASYVVTANGFLADGGDNFTTFEQVPATEKLDGGLDLTALIGYFAENSPVAPPSTDRVNEVG
jgi:5'-nucleotidase